MSADPFSFIATVTAKSPKPPHSGGSVMLQPPHSGGSVMLQPPHSGGSGVTGLASRLTSTLYESDEPEMALPFMARQTSSYVYVHNAENSQNFFSAASHPVDGQVSPADVIVGFGVCVRLSASTGLEGTYVTRSNQGVGGNGQVFHFSNTPYASPYASPNKQHQGTFPKALSGSIDRAPHSGVGAQRDKVSVEAAERSATDRSGVPSAESDKAPIAGVTLTKGEPRPSAYQFEYREATVSDAARIITLRDSLDMHNATSFVWEVDELRRRIETKCPLVVVATTTDATEGSPTFGQEIVVGVTGIDLYGMEKDFTIVSIGSRLLGVPANSVYAFPANYSMCRGLLVHKAFQGAGLGSKLHKARLKLLADIAPDTPGVILSARGNTIEEALAVIDPMLTNHKSLTTIELTKDDIFEFTFHTSKGVAHLVHGKERDGWKFVGVDQSDGGPVWVTNKCLRDLVAKYDVDVLSANRHNN